MIPVFSYKYSFVFLFFFAMLMPLFHNYIGSAGVLLVNGFLIFYIFVFLVFKTKLILNFRDFYDKGNLLRYCIPLALFVFLIPLSMVVGFLFGDVSIIKRDFYELYRPVLYLLVFVFSYFCFSDSIKVVYFEKIILIVFLCVVALGLNHFFRVFDGVSELYTKFHNIKTSRVSTPFVNPYDYAFFMTFFVYYFFIKFLYSSFYYILFFLVSLTMLLLPQSRSVVAGFLIGFFVLMPAFLIYSGANISRMKVNKKLIYFFFVMLFSIVAIVVFLIPYLLENFSYLTGQFVRLIEKGEVGNSAGTRLGQFMFAFDKAVANPLIFLFGNGPAKNEMEYVESIYNYLFYRYGLSGLLLYFFVLWLSILQCFKIVKKIQYYNVNYSLFLAILLWFITIPLLSIGNNFTEQVRLSFFYYMILGFVASSYYKIVIKSV